MARAHEAVPTGIDRVEFAYARYLIEHASADTTFCAMHPLGRVGGVESGLANAFIKALGAYWTGGVGQPPVGLRDRIRRALVWRRPMARPGATYLLVSHHHLTRPKAIARLLRQTKCRFVPMIHDLIPTEYPEYARPREPARHERRLETVARYASGVIVPSEDVRDALCRRLARSGRSIPVWTIPHGVDRQTTSGPGPTLDHEITRRVAGRPYFVCLGTIEPRKNHLLLLHVWRRLVAEKGENAPVLVLIGKRGWENENIVDLLDRCPALSDHVIECNSLPDQTVRHLLVNSRALLFPSFVEGFGLPLAEALSLNVPAICSDIAVFRQIGGSIPDYRDPLDGIGWRSAIMAYASTGLGRTAQIGRLANWSPLTWDESVSMALSVM
nr:glycosyltransferase family 1 protein [Ameyamaea chiangmaiensis]